MSTRDDDLKREVSTTLMEAYLRFSGEVPCDVLAQAAIDAVRRHDAAKVVPFRRSGPVPVRTPGWDGDAIAARHAPEGPR